MQSEITIKNLKKYFAEIKAVDDISFTVQKGEFTMIPFYAQCMAI